jgi:hypothetical protein
MTAFSDLVAAIVAKLTEAPALAGGRVYRGQAWPMPETTDSMIWVRILSSTSERTGILFGPVDWSTAIEIEIRVRYAPDSQSPDAAVDDLIGLVYERLAAFSLQGVEDIIPGSSIDWDHSETDVNVIGATVRADVVHRTLASQLTAV